jgi:molybdenum cofactor cytidylyltransferase
LEAAFKVNKRERKAANAHQVNTAGIILAAGASQRMGTPKALLAYEGETFLDRLIRIFGRVCSEVIVVLGRDAKTVQAGLTKGAQVHFVINADWRLGQLSSLQCGLTVAAKDTDAVLFTPVDCPAVDPHTPQALLTSYEAGTHFVVPRFQGRHGHPVLFNAALIGEFLALNPEAAARDVVHRYIDSTRYVDVDDPGILRDIDEPADYQALVGVFRE